MSDILDGARERVGGLVEFVVGSAVATTPAWSPYLDAVVQGAHAVAALGGALIALHGLWRIARRRVKRRGDDT